MAAHESLQIREPRLLVAVSVGYAACAAQVISGFPVQRHGTSSFSPLADFESVASGTVCALSL
jgi:hypothetical protein